MKYSYVNKNILIVETHCSDFRLQSCFSGKLWAEPEALSRRKVYEHDIELNGLPGNCVAALGPLDCNKM